MFTPEEEAQLRGQAECFIHFHTSEPISQADEHERQYAVIQNTVTADYVITSADDYILVDSSAGNVTITLPSAGAGREYEVIKVASSNRVDIVPTSPDTVLWASGVSIYNRGTAVRFKATSSGNWVAI